MRTCDGSPAEEAAERYLKGELSEPERECFEEHFFSCDVCHRFLETLRAIQGGLQSDAGVVAGSQPMRIVARGRSVKTHPLRVAVLGGIAAALLVAGILAGLRTYHNSQTARTAEARNTRTAPPQKSSATETKQHNDAAKPENTSKPSPGPAMELASLADVSLPGYQAPHLRGTEANDAHHTAFVAGMERYAAGDCQGGLEKLKDVPSEAADGVAASLYSGLCHFKSGDLANAQGRFDAVVSAGDTPQLETADYYLAQVMLLRSNAGGAKEWLNKTIALHGDYEEKAQAELSRLNQAAHQH